MKPCGILVVALPGLDHVMAEDVAGAVQMLDELQERLRGGAEAVRREGERIVAVVAEEALLGLAVDTVQPGVSAGQGHELVAAAAVGWGPALRVGDEIFGAIAAHTRRLALLARPGEVLCPEPLHRRLPLPDGVGAHLAPAALCRLFGGGVQVLRDYRG